MGLTRTSYKCGPNGPLKDYAMERRYASARSMLGINKYEGRHPDYSEEILRAMPCTVMQMYKQGICDGLTYVALWTRVQALYDMGWVHVAKYEKHEANGQYQTFYGAGPGEDARMPTDDPYRDPLPPVVINPNRKANPFDALLGYGT